MPAAPVPSRVRWIFFDAFGTLFNYMTVLRRAAGIIHRRQRLPFPLDRFHAKWSELSRRQMNTRWHVEPYRPVREWFAQSLRDTFDHFQCAGDVHAAIDVNMRLVAAVPLFPESAAVLDRLRSSFRLAVVSNIDRPEIEKLLCRRPLPLDLLVTSQDARAYKPDPAFFNYALAASAAAPEEVVHVGDSPRADVQGARLAAVTPVWINRMGKTFPSALLPEPLTVTSLDHLPSLLARLSSLRD